MPRETVMEEKRNKEAGDIEVISQTNNVSFLSLHKSGHYTSSSAEEAHFCILSSYKLPKYCFDKLVSYSEVTL